MIQSSGLLVFNLILPTTLSLPSLDSRSLLGKKSLLVRARVKILPLRQAEQVIILLCCVYFISRFLIKFVENTPRLEDFSRSKVWVNSFVAEKWKGRR